LREKQGIMPMEFTRENQEAENNDPTIKRSEEELSRYQAVLYSANYSLWSSILTINGIFLAFSSAFSGRYALPPFLPIFLSSIFMLPILIVLFLFYINKKSKNEYFKAYFIVNNLLVKQFRKQETEMESIAAVQQNKKAQKVGRQFTFANNVLEKVAIILTFLSVLSIFALVIIIN
jgi:hypothetical protein